MHYLGRYTHRIAISNRRILRMDENTVTIRVKDYKRNGEWKELTLDGVEFVRRFLIHVPPKGFVRIRHYGLISNHNKRKLIPICRNLIGCREFLRRFRKNDKVQAIRVLYKKMSLYVRVVEAQCYIKYVPDMWRVEKAVLNLYRNQI